MTHINNLPVELLFGIFVDGCTDELEVTDFFESHPRKPKRFAALSRAVCPTWRNLIDLPSSKCFWISRLQPSLHSRRGDKPFIWDLLQFKDYLTRSNGCDLVIKFASVRPYSYGYNPVIEEDVDALPKEKADRVKLLLCGMSLVKDYQEQIVSLKITVSPPQIDAYFSK